MKLARLSDLGVASSFGPYIMLGSVATLVGVIAWFIVRTRSMHLITARLWLLFHGRKLPAHRRISTFFEHRSALMLFRFFTSVPARTLKVATSLMTWCDKNDEEIGDVALCGSLFDIETCELRITKLTPRWQHAFTAVKNVMGIAAVLASALLFLNTETALLTMTESRQQFLLHENSVKALKRSVKEIAAADCATPDSRDKAVPMSGFTRGDVDSVCSLMMHPKVADFRQDAVDQQRVALLIMGGILLVIALVARREELSIQAYLAMKKRMAERSKPAD